MSKISKKQAEELFPFKSIDGGQIEAYFNAGQLHKREIYIECYDQAFQDFLEKACEWLTKNADGYTWYNKFHGESGMTDDFINNFKNYMENEEM